MAEAPANPALPTDEESARAVHAGGPWARNQDQRESGTSPGINIGPGEEDDGWTIPGPVSLLDGTKVQLYKDGQALKAAYEAIENARFRICLEVYIFRSDPTGLAFAKLLARRAREGVSVFVLYDSFATFDTDPKMFRDMQAAGVNLQAFHEIRPWACKGRWRPLNRDHRKLIVVDNDVAWLGGLNIGGEYAGSWIVKSAAASDCPWRDNAVELTGPATRTLAAAFAGSWNYTKNGGRLRKTELFAPANDGDFGVLASSPTRMSPLLALMPLIRNAKKSILMTMAYFAPPDELIDLLIKVRRRGVRVRLMLPGKCDIKLLLIAARSFYDKLLANGIDVYERQNAILHAKTMCIDSETTIIGSTNLDYRSIEYNLELSVLIRNREFGRQIHDLFENDVCFAKKITPSAWRKRPRPIWDRFMMWAVARSRYLL